MRGEADEVVAARRAVLDALEALEMHRDAVVLVGAQAIYVRLGEADVAVSPFTVDGDLVIDPDVLADTPPIAEAMMAANFHLREADEGGEEPGIWKLREDGPTVDLLVPRSLRPVGRRGARLGAHGNRAAKTVPGLEGALIDRERLIVAGLAPDPRRIAVWVAGPAALLVMKLHKIADHLEDGRTVENKDAYDVLRLLRDVPMDELASRYSRILKHPSSGASARRAVELLRTLFGTSDAIGSRMAAEAAAGLTDPAIVATSCAILAQELLEHVSPA